MNTEIQTHYLVADSAAHKILFLTDSVSKALEKFEETPNAGIYKANSIEELTELLNWFAPTEEDTDPLLSLAGITTEEVTAWLKSLEKRSDETRKEVQEFIRENVAQLGEFLASLVDKNKK